MGTTQDKMKAVLAKAGIPSKKIDCYGSQIVITSFSRDAAVRVFHTFACVGGEA